MLKSVADVGIAGLFLLLYCGLDCSPAFVTFVENGLIFLFGSRLQPKVMIIKSIAAIPIFSIFLFIMEDFGSAMDDPLLAALYAGVFTGLGFGFIFRSGSTVGGTSTIAKMLNYKFGWGLTETNFVLDALVVVGGILVIGPILTLYTLVALFIGKRVTDYILEGFESKKVVHIFSDDNELIARSIREIGRAHV